MDRASLETSRTDTGGVLESGKLRMRLMTSTGCSVGTEGRGVAILGLGKLSLCLDCGVLDGVWWVETGLGEGVGAIGDRNLRSFGG